MINCKKCRQDKSENKFTIGKKITCDKCINEGKKGKENKLNALSGLCKLCGDKNVQLHKSHIIPDFMYKGMKDSNGDIICFTLKSGGIPKKEATEYLFCTICENNILNKNYEDLSAKLLNGSFCEKKVPILLNKYNYLDNIIYEFKLDNYKTFKNFLLSILWRCSVYSGDMLNNIKLGPYEEKLREIIHGNIDTSDEEFPITVWNVNNLYLANKQICLNKFIVPPFSVKISGILHYYMFINGFIYDIIVSSHNKNKGTIANNNIMCIIDYPKEYYIFLKKFFKVEIVKLF